MPIQSNIYTNIHIPSESPSIRNCLIETLRNQSYLTPNLKNTQVYKINCSI